MSTNIYYFSATGNSLAVAKDIAAGLPEARIFSIPQVMDGEIDLDADRIGIVFPEYFSGIPRIVSDFIKRLEPKKIKFLFAVCTYGGIPANTLPELQGQLQAAGIRLNAGYAVPMPGSYIVKYGAFKKAKQEKLFRKEKEAVQKIVRDITVQKDAGVISGGFAIGRIGKFIYQSMLPKFPVLDRNFTVDEKCTGCGICKRVCPAGNVRMSEDQKPRWQGNCEHCMACIQWCPEEAIQYSLKTAGRERYRHPDIRPDEMFNRL